jgi:hypothetical protein
VAKGPEAAPRPTLPPAATRGSRSWSRLPADEAVASSAAGGHARSHELQGLVEEVIGKLPDQVEPILAYRRIDFPHVGIVQLLQLLAVAHVSAFQP